MNVGPKTAAYLKQIIERKAFEVMEKRHKDEREVLEKRHELERGRFRNIQENLYSGMVAELMETLKDG